MARKRNWGNENQYTDSSLVLKVLRINKNEPNHC